MNRLAHWMMRLYPARWRQRYGDELDALLADTGADTRIVTDLFRGGMRMQFKTWPFLKLAVTLGLAGLLLGAGLAKLLPSEYTSRATLQITPAQVSESSVQSTVNDSLNDRIQQMEETIMSRTELAGIINDPRLLLYQEDLRTHPLDDVIEEMKQNIQINFVRLPGKLRDRATAFDIMFTYPDPMKAQQTVRAFIAKFEEQNQSIHAPKVLTDARIEVLGAPDLQDSPVYPTKPMALLGGFLLGVLLASIWRMTRQTGFIVRRFAPVAMACGVVCAPVYFVAHALRLVPYQYRSTATIRLRNTPQQISQLEDEVLSRTSLSMLVNDPRLLLYKWETQTAPPEKVFREMKQHLSITHYGRPDGAVLTIAFDYPDNYKARQTVEAIVSRFDDVSRRWYQDAAPLPVSAPVIMDVLDTPNLPGSPSSPRRRYIAVAGGLWGVFAAAVIALIRRRWKPESNFPADVVQG